MKPIIINQYSENKDCDNLHPIHYIAYNGRIILPVAMKGMAVAELEAHRAGQEVSFDVNA